MFAVKAAILDCRIPAGVDLSASALLEPNATLEIATHPRARVDQVPVGGFGHIRGCGCSSWIQMPPAAP